MGEVGKPGGKALLVSYTDIDRDPRVRREVNWLVEDGWTVDTLGLGNQKVPGAAHSYFLEPPRRWVTSRLGYLIAGAVLPRKVSFRRQLLDRVPTAVIQRVKAGFYDLIVLNDQEFLPWLTDDRALGSALDVTQFHVDMHEKRNPRFRRDTVGARLAAPYYRWRYRQLANPRIHSRTVVNQPIGALYAEELGIPDLTPIRNIPPFEDLTPVDRGDGKIKLLFHGMGGKLRGIQEIVEAMGTLPDRFEATFMLMPSPDQHLWLKEMIEASPARGRIEIVPPAPMTEIAKSINRYDMEIIYLPPSNMNLTYASPNKFYEALQGRLALAVRDDFIMAPLVREWGNGVVVPGHSGTQLADALRDLTVEEVQRMKLASNTVAQEVNAEAEGKTFLRAVRDGAPDNA
ncbi:hypothetical protein [Actinomyces minihominis]|uniref:hypothetical protein n=1 Tax=Actinomyces minihominis TaxID=2002838 RepID=UPI000C089C25|nr:hypothetical protein [Actinomyces minihominis]